MSLEQRFSTATQVKRSGKSLTSEIEVNTNRISPECDQNPPSYQSKIHPKDFFKLIRATTLSSAVVAVVSSLLISLDSELSEKDTTSVVCRVICIVLSVCQVLLVLRYHYYHMKVRMSEMSVVATSAWEGLWRHDKLLVMCEVMVNGVFVPPGVSGAVKYDQLGTYSYLSIGNLLTPCIYLRLYHCLRKLHGITTSILYIAKLTRRAYGAVTIFLISGLFFTFFGLVVFTFEQSVPGSLFNLWNSQWLTAVTQCTIGYGDMTPKTHLGRISIIATIFVGIFITSSVIRAFALKCRCSGPQLCLTTAIRDSTGFRKKFMAMAAVLIQRRWVLHRKRVLKLPSFFTMIRYRDWKTMFRRMRHTYLLSNRSDLPLESLIDAFQKRLSIECATFPSEIALARKAQSASSRLLTVAYSIQRDLQNCAHIWSRLAGSKSRRSSTSYYRHGRHSSLKIRLKQATDVEMKRLFVRRSEAGSICSSERS